MPRPEGLNLIGVVVGRKGSKGLPGKNVANFMGKPLVEWTMQQARDSKLLTAVVVSSDDEQVLALGEEYGFQVAPRPAAFASDRAPIGRAIEHALSKLGYEISDQDVVILLEPTSPLRPKGFIDACLSRFLASVADSAVSVGRSNTQHPAFSVKLNEGGELEKLDGSDLHSIRRQDLDDVYFLEGSFYCSRVSQLRASSHIYGGVVIGIPVRRWQEIEIDDEVDFAIAERLGEMYAREL